jgi:hypothetical protein
MQPDGSYIRAKQSGEGFSAQDWLMQQATAPHPNPGSK